MSRKSIFTRIRISRQICSVFILSGFCTIQALGQGLGNTPYSVYGIGETFSGAFAAQQMMGGSGVSYSNGLFINNLNPALIARNRITTLEIGAVVQSKQMRQGPLQQQSVGGGLNYLAMTFPLNSRWTIGVNYAPHTYLDYSIREYNTIAGSSYYSQVDKKGTGGTNKVSLVNGFRVFKNLYAGITASYLFGNMTREYSSQTFVGDGNDNTLLLTDIDQHKNFIFKGGLAYRIKFNDKRYINVGGTYELPAQLRTTRLRTFSAFTGDIPVAGSADTLSFNSRGKTNMPASYKVGLSYENPYRLAVSADFTMNQWSQFRDFDRSSQNLKDSYHVNVGVEYTPNITSSTYWSRLPYRFGVNYGQMPYTVRGQRITEASVSAGLGLPLTKVGLSDANLGFTYGQRGNSTIGVVKEQFFRVTLGFTISDQWFYRQVVD